MSNKRYHECEPSAVSNTLGAGGGAGCRSRGGKVNKVTRLRRRSSPFVRGPAASRGPGGGDSERPLRRRRLSGEDAAPRAGERRLHGSGRRRTRFQDPGRPRAAAELSERPPSPRLCAQTKPTPSPSFRSPGSPQTFPRPPAAGHPADGGQRGGCGAPSQGGGRAAGPRVLGPRAAGPALTHLMLFHHFTEAGIPLRDPSVKLGDSHFDRQR